MSREMVSLVESCKQHPDDGPARLVLADWLEEHGDTQRAELVRLHATSGAARGRPEFEVLKRHLWEAGRDRWTPFQHALQRSVMSIDVGGFVGVGTSPKGLIAPRSVRWAGTPEWTWVDRVLLSPRPDDLTRLLTSPLLATVGTLSFEQATLTEDAVRALAASPALESLRGLRFNYGGCADLADVARSPRAAGLHDLCVNVHPETPTYLTALADPDVLPRLRRLELPSGSDPVLTAEVLRARPLHSALISLYTLANSTAALSGLAAGLRRLHLTVPDGQFDPAALASSPAWTTLEAFSTRWHSMTDDDLRALATGPALRELECFLQPGAGAALGPLLPRLTSLALHGMHLGPALADALTGADAAPVVLDLSGCAIGDDGVRALAKWPGLARCRVLSLWGNRVTAAGVRALADSPHAAGLVGLDLSGNPIGPDGVALALRGPWDATLESLQMYDNGCPRPNNKLFRPAPHLPRLRECRLGQLMSPAARAALAHVSAVE